MVWVGPGGPGPLAGLCHRPPGHRNGKGVDRAPPPRAKNATIKRPGLPDRNVGHPVRGAAQRWMGDSSGEGKIPLNSGNTGFPKSRHRRKLHQPPASRLPIAPPSATQPVAASGRLAAIAAVTSPSAKTTLVSLKATEAPIRTPAKM